MINLSSWNYLYKLDFYGNSCVSQHTYEPLINPEQNILCLNFTTKNNYTGRVLKEKTCDFFFKREIQGLEKFTQFPWCPNIIDVNYQTRKIFIEFSPSFLNHILYEHPHCAEKYKTRVLEILRDLYTKKTGKISVHTHCFFVGKDEQLKTIDFFSSFDLCKEWVKQDLVEDILSHDSVDLFRRHPFFNGKEYNLLEIYKFLLENDIWGGQKLNIIIDNLR